MSLLALLFVGVAGVAGIAIGYYLRFLISLGQRGSAELQIRTMMLEAQERAKKTRETAEVEAKELVEKLTEEAKARSNDLKVIEDRLVRKEETLDKRQLSVDTGEVVCRYRFPRDDTPTGTVQVRIASVETTEDGDVLDYTLEVHHRRPTEDDRWLNAYVPMFTVAWRANMDVQFVGNPYRICSYICKYVTKDEHADKAVLGARLCEYLRRIPADDEHRLRREIRGVIHHIGLGREVSAQEAAWVLLKLPFYTATRDVVYVPVAKPAKRRGVLYPADRLSRMADDDEGLFVGQARRDGDRQRRARPRRHEAPGVDQQDHIRRRPRRTTGRLVTRRRS